ncbi:MAG: hypothetical protein ABI091_10720 [Ferruginibacter sp.]
MKRRNFISGIGTMSGMLAMSSAMAGKEFAENFRVHHLQKTLKAGT